MEESNVVTEWIPIIGRAVSLQCLHTANLADKGLGEQATFLQRLGLPNKDIASLLNTSEGSIRALLSYAGKKNVKIKSQSKKESNKS